MRRFKKQREYNVNIDRKKRRKIKKYISTLEDYNCRLKEMLLESRFIKWLLKNKLGYSISFVKKTMNFKIPEKEDIRAFLLTYRIFIQRKDRVSLSKLNNLYGKLPLSAKEKNNFYLVRNQINKFFKKEPTFTISGYGMKSNRLIHDIVLYGYFAHMNSKKYSKYKKWMKDETLGNMILIDFCSIIEYVFRGLVLIYRINQGIITKLNFLVRQNK